MAEALLTRPADNNLPVDNPRETEPPNGAEVLIGILQQDELFYSAFVHATGRIYWRMVREWAGQEVQKIHIFNGSKNKNFGITQSYFEQASSHELFFRTKYEESKRTHGEAYKSRYNEALELLDYFHSERNQRTETCMGESVSIMYEALAQYEQ